MEADMEERIRLGGVTGGNLGIERKVLSFRGIGGVMRRKPYSSGVNRSPEIFRPVRYARG